MTKVKYPVAIAIIAALTAGTAVFGSIRVRQAKEEFAAEERKLPESAITNYLQQLKDQDYHAVYEDAQQVDPNFNSEADYTAKLQEVYDGVDLDALQYTGLDNSDGSKDYKLYSNGKFLATLRLRKNADDTWLAGTIFVGDQNYTIEVPTGLSILANGVAVSKDYCKQTGVAASNFSGLGDQSLAPLVDVYELDNLLGEPTIEVDGDSSYGVLKDVLTNNLLIGKTSNDADLAQTMIDDIVTCARFTAQEATVAQVGAISVRNSDWWDRISTMPNTWFTSHSTSNFSNEQAFNIIQQSDDTMVGYVTFDYYASNGTVDRTWNAGYQVTFLKEGGTWKIACMAVDAELNPARTSYFEDLNS